MDYFSALNIFHHVADTGSFSRTAQQLGVAVSSVTRQIDSLENELGVALFSRSTRQISLTNAGILYLQSTRPILDDLDAANLSLKLELDQPQGKLRITFSHSYGSSVLAPILAEFALQYPKIQLEIGLRTTMWICTQNALIWQCDSAKWTTQISSPNALPHNVACSVPALNTWLAKATRKCQTTYKTTTACCFTTVATPNVGISSSPKRQAKWSASKAVCSATAPKFCVNTHSQASASFTCPIG